MDESEFRLPPDVRMETVSTPLSETIDWSHAFLGLKPEWYASDCSSIKVGVLDTGVALSHPDLKVEDAFDFTGSAYGPEDKQRHGTWCLGCIGAVANDIGVRGIAAGAKMYSLKVLGDNGSGSLKSIKNGIRRSIDLKLDIISNSYGGGSMDQETRELFKAFTDQGGYVFAAAGNDGIDPRTGQPYPENLPAAFAEVLGIAACNKQGKLTDFSCYDQNTCCAGPGYQMLSTTPEGYALMSGTSMACPAVAGVFAKILAKHRAAQGTTPITNYKHAQEHIRRTATVKAGLKIINPMGLFGEIVDPNPTDPGSFWKRIRFNVKTVNGETILIGITA